MKKIDKLKAAELIFNSNGKTFTVDFIKKDGTVRTMNCRLGVTKHLKGGTLKFNPLERGLINVFDMQKGAYRMINFKNLISINIDKKQYKIEA